MVSGLRTIARRARQGEDRTEAQSIHATRDCRRTCAARARSLRHAAPCRGHGRLLPHLRRTEIPRRGQCHDPPAGRERARERRGGLGPRRRAFFRRGVGRASGARGEAARNRGSRAVQAAVRSIASHRRADVAGALVSRLGDDRWSLLRSDRTASRCTAGASQGPARVAAFAALVRSPCLRGWIDQPGSNRPRAGRGVQRRAGARRRRSSPHAQGGRLAAA